MKKFFTIVASMFLSLSFGEAFASNYTLSYSINLIKTYNDEPNHSSCPQTTKGRRSPQMPIPCIVSEAEGITVAIDEADILAYEIWDAEGSACVASYVEGSDAATHLLSTPGEYQLRIITNEYSYIGYITTL